MSIDVETRSIIGQLTSHIIAIYQITIPINNIDEVVETIGGRVIEREDLSEYFEGSIRKVDDDSFEIVVSKHQPLNRRSFTIAHELGHLFLHMGYRIDIEHWRRQTDVYYRMGNSQEEYEANEFAAALLMPEADYKSALERHTKGNIVDTAAIANEFNVSVNAASNRGKWLGYLQW